MGILWTEKPYSLTSFTSPILYLENEFYSFTSSMYEARQKRQNNYEMASIHFSNLFSSLPLQWTLVVENLEIKRYEFTCVMMLAHANTYGSSNLVSSVRLSW